TPDEELLNCLRTQSVEAILAAQPGNIIPATGTDTLPESITAALQSGELNQVPGLRGRNQDEGTLVTLLALGTNRAGPPPRASEPRSPVCCSRIRLWMVSRLPMIIWKTTWGYRSRCAISPPTAPLVPTGDSTAPITVSGTC